MDAPDPFHLPPEGTPPQNSALPALSLHRLEKSSEPVTKKALAPWGSEAVRRGDRASDYLKG